MFIHENKVVQAVHNSVFKGSEWRMNILDF